MAIKKTKKVKVEDKDRSVSSRNLEDHVIGEAKVVEKGGLGLDKDLQWEATQGEVHSDVKLEDDKGTGKAVVLRAFDFAANPEAFKHHVPSKQELFNAHRIQIEHSLMGDGLKIFEEVSPKVIISKNKRYFRIIVAGLPWGMNRSHISTLSQIANGQS